LSLNEKYRWSLLLVVLSAVLLRILLLTSFFQPLDSDECAEVLMAMTVREQPHFYVGWFGQSYMGSMEIYLISILGFWGDWSPYTIRIVMLGIVGGQIILVAIIARKIAGDTAAIISVILMCLLSPYAYVWELRARNYQLMVFIVLLAVLFEIYRLKMSTNSITSKKETLINLGTGFLWGNAIWLNELSVLLFAPFLFAGFSRYSFIKSRLLPMLLGVMAGFSPRIISNLKNDFLGLKILSGSLLNISRKEYEKYGWNSLLQPSSDSFTLIEKMEGIYDTLGLSLLLSVLFVLFIMKKKKKIRSIEMDWLTRRLFLSILSVFLILSSQRYYTIAIPYLVLLLGIVFSEYFSSSNLNFKRVAVGVFVCCILSYTGLLNEYTQKKHSISEQILAEFFLKKKFKRGIAGYYISNPVMYYTRKRVHISSLGGPNFTARFMNIERDISRNGADFIVYRVDRSKSWIKALESYLSVHSIIHAKDIVADEYLVFHSFSEPIYPGSYLSEADMIHYERHSPKNFHKINEENANIIDFPFRLI